MAISADPESLFREVERRVSLENIERVVRRFNELHRYTGTAAGEAAVDYVVGELEASGIEYQRLDYEAYVSVPQRASIELEGRRLHAIAAVYSGEAKELRGKLQYSEGAMDRRATGFAAWKAEVEGRILLTHECDGLFAKRASDAGALAVIHIQKSGEDLIHHGSVGLVWGTPGLGDDDAFPFIPYVSVTRATGELLLSVSKEKAQVVLNVEMDNSIRRSSMPVARVRGKSEKFALVSAHYDSWYEGITDNAVGDAILIELARVFQELRPMLDRSLVFAWWSGHSDGRFAGSTWYCDNYWEELSRDCVAHVNIDLAGCKNADQVRARTTSIEGLDFTGSLISKYTGRQAKAPIPMIRGGDQSFWGAGIPITIMLKYEPLPENCDFLCPSGGVWWHTDQDSLDKMDLTIARRDILMNAELLSKILNGRHLPIDLRGFIASMRKDLVSFEERFVATGVVAEGVVAEGHETCFRPALEALGRLERAVAELVSSPYFGRESTDAILKTVAGELLRLSFSSGSPYYHDRAGPSTTFPLLREALGEMEQGRDEKLGLFARTDVIRQRNRLVGQLNLVADLVGRQLLAWEGDAGMRSEG